MFNINLLQDNSILICPSNIKKYLVRSISNSKTDLRIKFLTKEELKEGLNFSYDYDALVFLHDKYKLTYDNAEEVLRNLINREYSTKKTKVIYSYFNELSSNNLLKFNAMFKHLFDNKTVYIFGYSQKDKELVSLLSNNSINFSFLKDDSEVYKHYYSEFNTIEDEVLFVFNDIMSKIDSGVDINKIHIFNYSSDYNLLLKKYAYYHGLPIIFKDSEILYNSPVYKRFIELLSEHDIIEAYNLVSEETKNDPYDGIGRIANTINKILFLNLERERFIELLSYIAKKTQLKKIKYVDSISVIDDDDIINNDEYVYVLGFSLGNYPSIFKDTDFYSDLEKKEIGLNTSLIRTEIKYDQLSYFINHTKHLIITHKNKIGKNVFYPSLLISSLHMEKADFKTSNIRFNTKMCQIESANAKDNFRIYGVRNNALNAFTDDEIRYMNYNHAFKGLLNYDPNLNLKLSYSQINEYYECPFQYFVKRVLKANIFEDRFTTELGNLFHLILEDSVKKQISLVDYDEYIKTHFLTAKDLFFLNMLLPQVLDVIKKNNNFLGDSFFKDVEAEKEIVVPIDKNTSFVGKIDKILFDKNENNLAIVDYKTSNFYFEKKKLPYGINLQLPIYSFLLSKEYPNFYNLGMYIQNVCLDKKHLNDEDKEPYLLKGLTSNNQSKIMRFDAALGKTVDSEGKIKSSSSYIDGISVIKSGGLKKSKALTDEDEYSQLKEIALDKINNAITKIRNGEFEISPIKFKQDSGIEFTTGKTLCDRCSCKGICFMKNSDIRIIDLNAEEGE